ncbi:hypothetical protein SAMN05216207_101027 [Pseudonocardia ammonioxydans]|uniref:DUF7144 domain-containing protein n=1 Tax=Pseudonocardia ammonioxydans TaxID=260086 RepID=A0A1I4X2T7_PSUAM|nr:hypothetical protein [Pseudonocardia ammonioxydans]SFN20388.1 hypothetical protein SAMN05216207_101027 [Pseudonocardia ammonioxydans]
MSTTIPPRPVESTERVSPWAGGLSLFAAVLMVVGGVWHLLAGLAALFRDTVYVATPEYVYSFDLTAWGWVHLLMGVLLLLAGFGVARGQTWARGVGIVLAGLSLIANFLFIPHYPIWSLLIIALDVAVIWALATYRRDA